MVSGISKVAKLIAEAFQLMERLGTGFNMRLFSKTVIPFLGDKHHGHPVIAGVTRNLFRAIATYNIHYFVSPVAPLRGRPLWSAACDKKRIWFIWRKRVGLSSAGPSFYFGPRSIFGLDS